MFYLIIIIGGTLVTAGANILFSLPVDGGFALRTVLWAILSTVSVIAIDGFFAFLIRRLPERFFLPLSSTFAVSPRERRFYGKLGVKSWKRLVPELGMFTNFSKSELKEPGSSAYLGRFLLESNYGAAIHLVDMAVGFLILLLPFSWPLSLGLPIAVINAILNLLPVLILRYNTPPLRRLYSHAVRREERNASDRSAEQPMESISE